MKIGFLLFNYFPFGGLERDCLKTASICADRGHEVTILTQAWEGERPAGLQVEIFGERGFSNHVRTRRFVQAVEGWLSQNPIDCLVGFNKAPGLDLYYGADPCLAARLEREKGSWARLLPRYRHFLAFERAVFGRERPTRIALLTDHEIPVYQRIYGTPTERITVLPPGVPKRDPDPSAGAALRKRLAAELGWDGKDQLLLFVGSDFQRKGVDRILRAIVSLPPERRVGVRLAVAGDDRPGSLERLTAELGLRDRVAFLGARNDVPGLMQAADLLVHPARVESAGMVLVEALTFGLPVLVTKECGYASHVARSGGGVVLGSPFRQEEMNGALAEMLGGSREKWSRRGLEYARREDLYSCHRRLVERIEQVAQEKSAPATG